MKSKNKGRFTGRTGASAPVMMLLRRMTCSGQRSRTAASARVLDRAYALTGRGGMRRLDAHGVVAAVHLVRAEVDQEGAGGAELAGGPRGVQGVEERGGDVGGERGGGIALARGGGTRGCAVHHQERAGGGGGGGGGAVRAEAEGGANRLAHPLAGDGVRAVAHAGRVGGEGVVAVRVVARPPVHAGEHVDQVLAEVAAAAHDERATLRRHLEGIRRDRRRGATKSVGRARGSRRVQ